MRGIDGERLAERFERALPVFLVDPAHLAEPGEHFDANRRLLGQAEVDVECFGQIGPALGGFVEALERGERGALGPELVEDRAEGEDRLGLVVELVGERLGDLGHGRPAHVG